MYISAHRYMETFCFFLLRFHLYVMITLCLILGWVNTIHLVYGAGKDHVWAYDTHFGWH